MIRHKKLGYVILDLTDIEKSIPYYGDLVGLQGIASALDNDVSGVPGSDSVTLEFSFGMEETPKQDSRKTRILGRAPIPLTTGGQDHTKVLVR